MSRRSSARTKRLERRTVSLTAPGFMAQTVLAGTERVVCGVRDWARPRIPSGRAATPMTLIASSAPGTALVRPR